MTFSSQFLPFLCLAQFFLLIALALFSAGTSFKSPCYRFYPLQPLTPSQMLLASSFQSVRFHGDSTHEKQLQIEARHETCEILRLHTQNVMP
jgi:hypothetical protein